MEKYRELFNSYLKNKVTQFPSKRIKRENKIYFNVYLDDAFANCRLEHLMKLGNDISKILNINPEDIIVGDVERSCICVILFLHKGALKQNFCLSNEQIAAIKKLQYGDARIFKIRIENEYQINKELGKCLVRLMSSFLCLVTVHKS